MILSVLILAITAADSVNVFIGTEGSGHTTPAACVPFGMVQAGPDTGIGTWSHCSGYQYSDNAVVGFSQTHLSGTGCPDMGDVSILPFEGVFEEPLMSRFKKADEHAAPGWYETRLERGEIGVKVTASSHVGFYEFSYTNSHGRLYVNLPFAIHYPQNNNWGRCRWYDSEVSIADDYTMIGSYDREVWCRRKVGFAIRFNYPVARLCEIKAVEGVGPNRYLLDFDLFDGGPLKVKIGLSVKGAAAALGNLEAEVPDWDFEAVRTAAICRWQSLISRFSVVGERNRVTSFYTSLYHLCVQPNDISDAGEIPFYSTLSCWDTYRAAHPLYTLFVPERVPDIIESMIRQGRITGHLPIWALWGRENQCMIATHSVPIIVDACMKGLWPGSSRENTTNVVRAAYRQIKETLTCKHERRIKEDWDVLDRYGYYPFDIITGESVSRTFECAYDDWCAAQMAKRLGASVDANFFKCRAENWKKLIDPATKMARGRNTHGVWRSPFNPFALGHGIHSGNDFTEGNSWQYTWHVQHDPEGLVAMLGGKEAFAARLENLFSQRQDLDDLKAHHDVSGMIGQYAHGNEPSHHVVYLFQYADRPDLTAKYVRKVFESQYAAVPNGLCGNEDCGQMSAWYIFSAMGFYPLNPCGGDYVIGAPQMDRVSLRLHNGRTFTVVAHNLSEENRYVKSVSLNGCPLEGFILKHSDILNGGELVFEMGDL